MRGPAAREDRVVGADSSRWSERINLGGVRPGFVRNESTWVGFVGVGFVESDQLRLRAPVFFAVRPPVLVMGFLVVAFFFDVFLRAGRPESPNEAS